MKTTIFFDVSAIAFFKNTSLRYSVSTTFYKWKKINGKKLTNILMSCHNDLYIS